MHRKKDNLEKLFKNPKPPEKKIFLPFSMPLFLKYSFRSETSVKFWTFDTILTYFEMKKIHSNQGLFVFFGFYETCNTKAENKENRI
jgi:hypothetical protein